MVERSELTDQGPRAAHPQHRLSAFRGGDEHLDPTLDDHDDEIRAIPFAEHAPVPRVPTQTSRAEQSCPGNFGQAACEVADRVARCDHSDDRSPAGTFRTRVTPAPVVRHLTQTPPGDWSTLDEQQASTAREVPMHHSWIDTELARVALFEGLSKPELRHVSAITTRLDLPAGRVLIRQGAPGREFFVMIDGEVQVVQEDRLIATRGAGEHVGELALVDRQPRSATVIASTPVAIGVMSGHDFRDLIVGVPDVAARIAATVAERRARLDADTGDVDHLVLGRV